MKVRTQPEAGGGWSSHNDTPVRSGLKAGGSTYQRNETVQTLEAGWLGLRGTVQTTSRKEDRLQLLVVRAGPEGWARTDSDSLTVAAVSGESAGLQAGRTRGRGLRQ